ncbi:MAG TPA: M56 family metallopeptidase [Pirellulales bacterium]|nr:M56 family metallopeptidase [Pirellulales bacterium]
MNEIAIVLLWCVLQATLNLAIGAAVYLIVRRLGPATGAVAAASTLITLCCLTVVAFSPWPRWWSPPANEDRTAAPPSPAVQAQAADEVVAATATGSNAAVRPARPDAAAPWQEYWRAFRNELREAHAPASPSETPRRWPSIVVGVIVGGALLALIRYLSGIVALRRYRRRLLPLTDRRLRELTDSLAQQFGCRRPIELKQSPTITTPATMGWLHPVIVLPGDCQTWTDTEKRVVLAHEVAHIARSDYLTSLVAHVAVALHVYHPLVHWLARRLRLEQELAADAWATEASGGRETYLFTLAQMALRQDDRRVAWAARPFLPSRGTLLRRIEMLSETKWLPNAPVSRRRAAALAGVAGLVALVVSGLRAPLGEAPRAHAAPPDKSTSLEASAPFDLTYVPPTAVAVFAARPAALFSKLENQPLVKLLDQTMGLEQRTGVKVENLAQVTVALTRFAEPGPQGGPPTPSNPKDAMLCTLQYNEPFDWKAKLGANLAGNLVEATVAGKTYYHSDSSDQAVRPAIYLPDDRTAVIGPEIDLQRVLLARGRNKPEWSADWDKLKGVAAAMVDVSAVNRAATEEWKHHPQPQISTFVGPILEKSHRLFLSAQADTGLSLTARFLCTNAADAERVRDTFQAVLTLARNGLDEADRNVAKATAAQAAAIVPLIDLAGEALKQGKLKAEEGTVSYTTSLDLDLAETAVTILMPAVTTARDAARHAQDMNNMKQIMLALHNYHDVFGHFPAPSVLGPDGKTRHSWRVAILPFVEQVGLYQRYKMDEPWDSENNKKVLAQIPPVYRDTGADPKSVDASYFALVGDVTAFGPREGKGTGVAEMTDGTSNTIALVEAKRSIPWTKPEDIDYDPAKPLPKLGGWHAGGFLAAFADGSIRQFPDKVDPQQLQALITKAGGEIITNP